MPETDDHFRRARAELTALGVPSWAQSGASGEVRYHAWVENGVVDGRLLFPAGSDEAHAIRSLHKQADEILSHDESDWPPRDYDLSCPCPMIVLRPSGFGHGGCPPHPDVDWLPLGALIRQVMSKFEARLKEIRAWD